MSLSQVGRARLLRAGALASVLLLVLLFVNALPALAVDYTLSGRVTDQAGNPLAGATVEVLTPGATTVVVSTSTNAGGNYVLSVAQGVYDIRILPPAGSSFGASVTPNQNIIQNMTLDFALVPAGAVTLRGRVTNPAGEAADGVQVMLAAGNFSLSTRTDQTGVYSLTAAPGNYKLELTSYKYSPTAPQSFQVATSGNLLSLSQDTTFDIVLPVKRVAVRVQDPAGNPIAGVKIQNNSIYNFNLFVGTMAAYGYSDYSSQAATDSSGMADLWLIPTATGNTYALTAVPPTGSPFAAFTINNVIVDGDKSLIIVLQFVHAPPATTVTVTPQPDAQGFYPSQATLTLAATAASGYTVAATYYKVDGGIQQTYTAPFTVSGDGAHTVQYWSVDNLGVFEFAKTLTINIASLRITTEPPLPAGLVGQAYSAQLAAAGGAPPYTWSIAAGALPPGLVIDPASGLISGTPTAAGTYGFTVQVRDSSNATATKPLALAPPPPSGNAGSGYSVPVIIDPNAGQGGSSGSGSTPSACSNYNVVSGALPPGLTLDPATGLVSGTPIDGGAYTFTIGCIVASGPQTGQTATKEFTITIYNLAPEIASLSPASAVAGGPAFELTVNGANFVASSVVRWNGADRPTTYVSAGQVRAQIAAADIAAVGNAAVTVFNPAPNGGESNAAAFAVLTPNSPPAVAAGGPYSAAEGDAVTLAATATDPDDDPLVYGWDLDGDGVFETAGQLATFSAAGRSGPTAQPVTVRVCDDDNACATDATLVKITNVAPTPNAGEDITVYRNDAVAVRGNWSDPAGVLDNDYTWHWDLDGDGVFDESGSAAHGAQIVRTTSFVVPGVATLSFQVMDKDGAAATDTVQITVLNRSPVAADQVLSTNEDTPLAIMLTAGDADNDSLAYTLVDSPQQGSLEGTSSDLTYTPAANYNGADSFTFQVNDGLAESNIATVQITIIPVNDPPVVLADTAETGEDTPVIIAVLANDSAGPADENPALVVSAVSDPAKGAAVANGDGTITYTPDLDSNGEDNFTYTACDADNVCASAEVTVLVAMVNDPPVAVDDNAATAEDTPVQIDVAANDSDVDGNLDRSTVALVSNPVNGAAASLGNGLFAYTPAADFNGEDSFTYQICDSNSVCATANVLITVAPVNDPPVCTAAIASIDTLWPPDHRLVLVEVNGVTDIEGNPIAVTITGIFQDEPTNGLGDGDTSPDGEGIGTPTARVRAERSGKGNGRYYHIGFSAGDGNGGSCSGEVLVGVPKSQGSKGAPLDDGARYDSTRQ